MPHFPNEIEYSQHYTDDFYEYRHVILDKKAFDIYRQHIKVTKQKILTENEWRNMLGIRQTKGWAHFMVIPCDPNILIFRRSKYYDYNNGKKLDGYDKAKNKYDEMKEKNLNVANLDVEIFKPIDANI